MTICFFFFFNDTATTEIYTLSLHDALPISQVEPEPYRGVGQLEVNEDEPVQGGGEAVAIRVDVVEARGEGHAPSDPELRSDALRSRRRRDEGGERQSADSSR